MLIIRGINVTSKKHFPFFNKNAVIAAILGVLLLVISYFGVPDKPFWHDFSHEIGFALVVAVTIWVTFEFFNQVETDEHWNERIEVIAKNVFFGVFKRNFPPEFIKEANILVLEHQFIRSGMHLTYSLIDKTFKDRNGVTKDFVKLSAVARCKMKNIGNATAQLPIVIGLPNPLIDEMKAVCMVNSVTIKQGGKDHKPNLAQAEALFREQMTDDSRYQVPFSLPFIEVQPDETVELILDYSMAKEDEDTEIFQSLYPADSIAINVMDQGPTKRIVRARSIHFSPLENDTSAEANGVYNFKLDKYLLPHQGFAIWWKKVP
jgi:hypothetical protein